MRNPIWSVRAGALCVAVTLAAIASAGEPGKGAERRSPRVPVSIHPDALRHPTFVRPGSPLAHGADHQPVSAAKAFAAGRRDRSWVDPGEYWSAPVQRVRPDIDDGFVKVGAVTSQADLPTSLAPGGLGAADARTLFGVDGSGVRIGIISDSYDAQSGASAGVESGDLPGAGNPLGYTTPVTVLLDDLDPSRIDEGRALAELIHDLAPGAELCFHSAFNGGDPDGPTESGIAAAIDALAAAGCDIIVDDVGALSQPYFQDGLAARSYDAAFGQGIACYSSAGNDGDLVWSGPYQPVLRGTRFTHNFDLDGGEDLVFTVDSPRNSTITLVLWWDEPFPSVSGDPGFELSDFDMFGRSEDRRNFGGSFADQSAGADPVEFMTATNIGSDTTVNIFINPPTGANVNEGVRLHLAVIRGTVLDDDAVSGGKIFGQANARGAMAVAAQAYSSDFVETFSSHGPGDIIFDTDGNIIDEIRAKPDITATDGVDTTFFPPVGLGSDTDGNGFPNFFGTSASAPHAAAVAALALEYARDVAGSDLAPGDLYDLMRDTAEEVAGTPIGPDVESGAGRLSAVAFLDAVDAFAAPCGADLTSTGASLPGQPGYGEPDGVADLDDLGYFLNHWLMQDPSGDTTTRGATIPGSPGSGEPDGRIEFDDLGYFLNLWLAGCN